MIQIDEISKAQAMEKLREISRKILEEDLSRIIDRNVMAEGTGAPYYYVFNGEREEAK